MPLLRKKEFQKTSIPENLRDDEEVFHCEVTNEIFRDYDEFCQRIILVNSMVWSCAMTGKTNLTYAEALQSERAAKKSIKDFPMELRIPVLYLATKTKRSAFGDMAEDVFTFVKDRYFVGEIVESSFTENNWQESHVLQVIAPTDEQIETYYKTNGKSQDKPNYPPASLYRYEVEQLDANDQDSSQVMMLEANHVRRKKGPYTREKSRLFLKQFIETNDQGIVVLKDSIRRKYRLDKIRFDKIFDGPPPDFEQTNRTKIVKAVNGKKIKQETLSKYLEKGGQSLTAGKSLLEEMKRKEEEYKQKVLEMKQKREEEKQKRKEENIKISSYVKEWYKPRDDLELEDHKMLPMPATIQSKISQENYGDLLMVLEFVHSFSILLSAKDFFPGGLTVELIERALTEKEVAGPFTDIIQMFLTALFNVQDEEAAESKLSRIQAEVNSDDVFDSTSLSDASRLGTLALNWSMVYQGAPLRRLPLCPMTVSEVLRLHLLSSGAQVNEAAAKWRYQQRGGYTSSDDPGLTLRVNHPHILRALAILNVNQLPAADKLKILTCLIDQLLTYANVRDEIEKRMHKTRQAKVKLRTLHVLERKYEQEVASARLKIKRLNKGKEEVISAELEKLQKEVDKKRATFEKRTQEFVKSILERQVVLGTDRAYQRYIKLEALPALLVENDERNPGRCLDKIVIQKPELVDAGQQDTLDYVKKLYEECNGSDKENENGLKKPPKKINGIRSSLKAEVDALKIEPEIETARSLLLCTANNHPCPVHSPKPSNSISGANCAILNAVDGATANPMEAKSVGGASWSRRSYWSFYYLKEDVPTLISTLNKRGIRESELKQILEYDKARFENLVAETNVTRLNATVEVVKTEEVRDKPVPKRVQNMLSRYEDSNLGFPAKSSCAEVQNLSLIDTILEMEEKIYTGSLGRLKVEDRHAWRTNLNNRNFEELDKTILKKEEHPQLEKLKGEGKNSRPGTPDSLYKDPGKCLGSTLNSDLEVDDEQKITVKTLGIALVQVSQAVDAKYLKRPLGNALQGNQKERNGEEHDLIEKWEQSLLTATSYSQLYLHYCTLDNCINWGRSAAYAQCRICHRKRDWQNMLLCDNCNKGHHLYCLTPKLTSVPKGDWFCEKCEPKEKPPSPPASKRTRKIFTEESDDDDDDDKDEEVTEEQEYEEDENEEEENGTEAQNGDISLFEVCEECGSGGHVICCDFCPKVYHLECTQPPLRRVPRGEWKCHRCRRKNGNHKDSVDPLYTDMNMNGENDDDGGDDDDDDDDDEMAQRQRVGSHMNRRRCAAKARHKIHGFIKTLRRNSVDSGSGEETPQRRSTRRTHDSKAVEVDDLPLHNASLHELLTDVMKHKDAWPFTRPVTKHEVPDYYDVIRKPMDFGTIKYKLNMGEYKCDAEVMADAALIFENCDTYNNSEALVYKCGINLLKFFEKRARELNLKFPEGLMGTEPENGGPTQPKKSRIN